MFERIILGGGISGLIAGYYLECPVIDKGEDRTPPAPFYLWNKKENRQLIEDLGYTPEAREIKIGYFYNKKFVKPDEKIREKYREKVGYKSSMSDLKTELEILERSPGWLMDELKKDVDVFPCEVTGIDGDEMELNFSSEIKYKNLISTIPLPEFVRLYRPEGRVSAFRYRTIFFDYIGFPEIWSTDYTYAYILDREFLYRATKAKDEGVCIGEFLKGDGRKVIKYGKIISGGLSVDSNVRFLGRFAEWNQQVRIHDVVRKVRSWI